MKLVIVEKPDGTKYRCCDWDNRSGERFFFGMQDLAKRQGFLYTNFIFVQKHGPSKIKLSQKGGAK